MKTRPWPLVLLAALQIVSPVGTVLFNAMALGVKPIYVLGWILERSPLQVFEALALMPIAGLAIYRMKAWSYAVFFVAIVWSFVSNIQRLGAATQSHSIAFIAAIYGIQIGLALYFIIPSVRRTYFDPRVRWWEAKRRYALEGPIELDAKGETTVERTQNISEGGVMIASGRRLLKGEVVGLSLTMLGVRFAAKGEIMYSIAREGGEMAYGIRFEHDRESRRRFKRMARGLSFLGVPHRDRDASLPWYVGFGEWALQAIKTGKGLIPAVAFALLSSCSMEVISVHPSRVNSAKIAEQGPSEESKARWSFRYAWDFKGAGGYLFDPSMLEISGGIAKLRGEQEAMLVASGGPSFDALTSFAEKATGAIAYQLWRDSTSWHYHDGRKWVVAGPSSKMANSAAEINARAGRFHEEVGRGRLAVRAFLVSKGSQLTEIRAEGVALPVDGWD